MLLIALKTHWSRSEILSLPAAEFNHYLDTILKALPKKHE